MPTVVLNNIPVATIDPIFKAQLDQLKDTARRIYIGNLAGDDTQGNTGQLGSSSQRRWQTPTPFLWDGNLYNISGITSIAAAYDRGLPNLIYVRALTKGAPILVNGVQVDGGAPAGEGRVADCQVEKIQIDYLAAQERAFRFRHASSIRCAVHAAARRRGQSTWGDGPDFTQMGGGATPHLSDVTGPIGGVFTNMIRYLYILLQGGYNEGPVDILHGPTIVTQQATGTVIGSEGEIT